MKSECIFLYEITQYSHLRARYQWNSSPKRLRNSHVLDNKKMSSQLSVTPTSKWWWFCRTASTFSWQFPQSRPIWSPGERTLRCDRQNPDDIAPTLEISLKTRIQLIIQHCLNARAGQLLEYDENFEVLRFPSPQFNSVHIFVTSQREIPISISTLYTH
jgi:hypothetical protein